jgi:site-specific recombinase XerD
MLSKIERFSKWLRRKSPQATTCSNYTRDLKLFFGWIKKPPDSITVQDIDAYIEHCQTDLNHATATINRRLAAIRSFYHFLDIEQDNAPANPVLPKRHFIRQGKRLPRDIEERDIEQLFSVIHSVRDRSMFLLMLRCGLRVSEVHHLSLGDLYIHPTPGSLPRLWLRGKNGSQRVAYLSTQAFAALQDWLEVRPDVADAALYVSRFGTRLKINTIQVILARYCRKAGVWITCHQLRHTFARQLTDAGMPVTSLQQLLGHARIRTTQVYMHVSNRKVQADFQAAVAQIMQRLSPVGGVR